MARAIYFPMTPKMRCVVCDKVTARKRRLEKKAWFYICKPCHQVYLIFKGRRS